MERIFHHYDKWEDYHAGMYNEDKTDRQTRVFRAARILGSTTLCRRAMEKVISEWKIATEYNLSNAEINRKAWLGQAACCCFAGIHEDETREAWGMLSDRERVQANMIASEIINRWLKEREQEDNPQITLFNDWGTIF